jgi:hypothetical protein
MAILYRSPNTVPGGLEQAPSALEQSFLKEIQAHHGSGVPGRGMQVLVQAKAIPYTIKNREW